MKMETKVNMIETRIKDRMFVLQEILDELDEFKKTKDDDTFMEMTTRIDKMAWTHSWGELKDLVYELEDYLEE